MNYDELVTSNVVLKDQLRIMGEMLLDLKVELLGVTDELLLEREKNEKLEQEIFDEHNSFEMPEPDRVKGK